MDTLITLILWGVAIIIGFKVLAMAASIVLIGAATVIAAFTAWWY